MKKIVLILTIQIVFAGSYATQLLAKNLSGKAELATSTKSTVETEATYLANDATLPVPVTNLQASFSVELQKAVVLTWEGLEENNNLTYIIERSHKEDFTEIGSVKTAVTLDKKTFCFTDFNPIDGASFYRLRISDTYNNFTYSAVVSAKNKNTDLIVFPNPAKQTINLHFPQTQNMCTISIVSANGKTLLVTNPQLNATEVNNLDVSTLNSGLYFVLFNDGKEISSIRFVKQ